MLCVTVEKDYGSTKEDMSFMYDGTPEELREELKNTYAHIEDDYWETDKSMSISCFAQYILVIRYEETDIGLFDLIVDYCNNTFYLIK